MSDKYVAITADRGRFPVRFMCQALGVSVGGYYASRQRPASAHACADERLRVEVRTVHATSRGRYGAPRVHAELAAVGVVTSEKRVARLMREDGLVARGPRRYVVTTDSDHSEPVAPNLLARRFDLLQHPTPDRAWVGDMSYVPTREGWLYLAVQLDLATRRVRATREFHGRQPLSGGAAVRVPTIEESARLSSIRKLSASARHTNRRATLIGPGTQHRLDANCPWAFAIARSAKNCYCGASSIFL